jgi:hypothetical protein
VGKAVSTAAAARAGGDGQLAAISLLRPHAAADDFGGEHPYLEPETYQLAYQVSGKVHDRVDAPPARRATNSRCWHCRAEQQGVHQGQGRREGVVVP